MRLCGLVPGGWDLLRYVSSGSRRGLRHWLGCLVSACGLELYEVVGSAASAVVVVEFAYRMSAAQCCAIGMGIVRAVLLCASY